MISIIDWRLAECERMGVDVPLQQLRRRRDDVLADKPDVVIVATGGLPHTEVLDAGNELVVSAWDILSGDVQPGTNVLDLR